MMIWSASSGLLPFRSSIVRPRLCRAASFFVDPLEMLARTWVTPFMAPENASALPVTLVKRLFHV